LVHFLIWALFDTRPQPTQNTKFPCRENNRKGVKLTSNKLHLWLHFLDSSSHSRCTWSTLDHTLTPCMQFPGCLKTVAITQSLLKRRRKLIKEFLPTFSSNFRLKTMKYLTTQQNFSSPHLNVTFHCTMSTI
jgi:hypothetical protein